jgi:hypothetical protein
MKTKPVFGEVYWVWDGDTVNLAKVVSFLGSKGVEVKSLTGHLSGTIWNYGDLFEIGKLPTKITASEKERLVIKLFTEKA